MRRRLRGTPGMRMQAGMLTEPEELSPVCAAVLADRYLAPGETTPEQVFRRVAHALAAAEAPDRRTHFARLFYVNMLHGAIGAGRIMANAGVDRQATMVNCFVHPIVGPGAQVAGAADIDRALKQAQVTLRMGGGVGYDFSAVAPMDALQTGKTAGPVASAKSSSVSTALARRLHWPTLAVARRWPCCAVTIRTLPHSSRQNVGASAGRPSTYRLPSRTPSCRRSPMMHSGAYNIVPSLVHRGAPPAPTCWTTATGAMQRCPHGNCGTCLSKPRITAPSLGCCSSTRSTPPTTLPNSKPLPRPTLAANSLCRLGELRARPDQPVQMDPASVRSGRAADVRLCQFWASGAHPGPDAR